MSRGAPSPFSCSARCVRLRRRSSACASMSSPHWEGVVEVYGVSFSSKEVLPLVACEFILEAFIFLNSTFVTRMGEEMGSRRVHNLILVETMEIACSLIHASLFFSAIYNPVIPAGTGDRYIYSVLGTACRRCEMRYHQTVLHTDRLVRSTGAWPAGNCVGLHARSACSGSRAKSAPRYVYIPLLLSLHLCVMKGLK